jgi:hypothetical protein
MALPSELLTLAHYLAGEFENREQSLAEPVWYVHLRLWQRPVHLFVEDSITLFVEQASVVKLDQPYRPRLLRLQVTPTNANSFQVQYYAFKDPIAVQGAGRNPDLLKSLTVEQIEFLPGCLLNVTQQPLGNDRYHFLASLPPGGKCCFTYQAQTYQVSLGFEASSEEFLSHDRGIDPQTGKAIWGAMLGPFRFKKIQDFAGELPR